MIKFSPVTTNLVPAATIAASTTFSHPDFPPENALNALRPKIRARTTTTADARYTIDFGSAKGVDVIALINVNFTKAAIQGHSSDVWTNPNYHQSVLVGIAPNDRYHHGHVTRAFNQQLLSIYIPSQATTDGATTFGLGGVYAGSLIYPPRDIMMEPDEETPDAFTDVGPDYPGAWSQRIYLDDPIWRLTVKRLAETEDELASWRSVDRQCEQAGAFLVLVRDKYPAECAIMKKMSSRKWSHRRFWSESTIDLCEVITP